jgi:A/G-specific adenine glycosylase
VSRRTRADVADELRRALLRWYEPRRSAYPWRGCRDPYAVLVSEVMLQQTQAARVVPAFERFMARFSSVVELASAERSAVIRAWDGLGYNRRAVALHRSAILIVAERDGIVPRDRAELRSLPGVGPYTAAAVAAIAYGVHVVAIDTNVRRVVSRVFAVDHRSGIEDRAAAWLGRADPGAWNQAVMDLGRTTCRPMPRCRACPLVSSCGSAGVAVAPPPVLRAEPFEGSGRQLRGAVVRTLRDGSAPTLESLSRHVGAGMDALAGAIRSLDRDGLVVAERAALRGLSAGRVRLP